MVGYRSLLPISALWYNLLDYRLAYPFKEGNLFRINPAIIALVAVVIAAFLVFVIAKVVGSHRRQASTERKEMIISVLPKTFLGKWSVGLTIVFMLFFVLIGLLLDSLGFDPFGSGTNTALAVFLKIIYVGLPGAVLATGLISMIKRKERSVLVLVSMVIGLWFLIGGIWLGLGGD